MHFAREAEKIVILDNQGLKAEGTLDEILRQDCTILVIFENKQQSKTSKKKKSLKSITSKHLNFKKYIYRRKLTYNVHFNIYKRYECGQRSEAS